MALAETPRLVRLPYNRAALLCRISRYIRSQQQETFSRPTVEEIAEALGISVEGVAATLNSSRGILSLDATSGDNDEDSLLKIIPDDTQESPDALLLRASLKEELEVALATLDEREREIIKLYYGLDGTPGLNLEELGSNYGLTRERIRQIKNKALCKLRNPKRAQKLMPYYAEEI